MHILIWLYDSTLFGSEVWLYNICIASMLFHALINSDELHISPSEGRRHNIIHCLGEDPQIPHIWETWKCHTMNLLVLFWKLIKTLELWLNKELEIWCLTWSFYLSTAHDPSESLKAPWLKVIRVSLKSDRWISIQGRIPYWMYVYSWGVKTS
jgi:hypothetical protein